jgi:chorismate mutase/prephenate dehydratase
VEVVVHQCLLGHVDQGASIEAMPLGRIERVLAHEQSLAQCRQFLERHLPRAERMAVSSNSEAARLAAEHSTWAALGSRSAADVYGLAVLAANVEDDPNNTTRFLIIGHNDPEPTGHDKTSLLLATRNESGALYGLLEPLARHGLSMVRIESRPSHRDPWDYHFFLDIEGHAAEARLAGALEDIKQKAIFFKLLGSYPSAVS